MPKGLPNTFTHNQKRKEWTHRWWGILSQASQYWMWYPREKLRLLSRVTLASFCCCARSKATCGNKHVRVGCTAASRKCGSTLNTQKEEKPGSGTRPQTPKACPRWHSSSRKAIFPKDSIGSPIQYYQLGTKYSNAWAHVGISHSNIIEVKGQLESILKDSLTLFWVMG